MGTCVGVCGLVLAGCKDLSGSTLPAGTINPSTYNTAEGAEALRATTIDVLQKELPIYVAVTGLFTDELRSQGAGLDFSGNLDIDVRNIPNDNVNTRDVYGGLQRVRADASLALQALAAYDMAAHTPHLRAEMFAVSAYAKILLADFFCSGVPLSTIDFHQDFTYQAGATTAAVYAAASTDADSALRLADTSQQIALLARVLKGRALLAVGDFAAAAQAVAPVPTSFHYQLAVRWDNNGSPNQLNWYESTISDNEGRNGLPYLSGGDPRAAIVVSDVQNDYAPPLLFPAKYSQTGFSAFSIADGIEARLIEAEAALHAGNAQWLTMLNALRTSGLVAQSADTIADTLGITGCGPDAAHWCAADGVTNGRFVVPTGYTLTPALGFTIQPVGAALASACYNYSYYSPCYNASGRAEVRVYVRSAGVTAMAGTGGVAGLAPLSDPGTPAGRIALMFQERAYWLFLTGHRQGDLRRLLRQYRQWFPTQSDVYPTGTYVVPRYAPAGYGTDVTAPIDPQSEQPNPLFHGCLNRDA